MYIENGLSTGTNKTVPTLRGSQSSGGDILLTGLSQGSASTEGSSLSQAAGVGVWGWDT